MLPVGYHALLSASDMPGAGAYRRELRAALDLDNADNRTPGFTVIPDVDLDLPDNPLAICARIDSGAFGGREFCLWDGLQVSAVGELRRDALAGKVADLETKATAPQVYELRPVVGP